MSKKRFVRPSPSKPLMMMGDVVFEGSLIDMDAAMCVAEPLCSTFPAIVFRTKR